MSDSTLDITAALREAHLQRLEGSLTVKAATKSAGSATSRPEPNDEKNNTPAS